MGLSENRLPLNSLVDDGWWCHLGVCPMFSPISIPGQVEDHLPFRKIICSSHVWCPPVIKRGNGSHLPFIVGSHHHSILPSGNLLHSYWKWPSRNSEFTQLENGGSFHRFLYVYQRVKPPISFGDFPSPQLATSGGCPWSYTLRARPAPAISLQLQRRPKGFLENWRGNIWKLT